MRRILVLGVMLAVAATFLQAVPAQAVTARDRQRQIERERAVLQSKIRDAEARAQSISRLIAESDAKRATLEKQIASLAQQIKDAEAQLVVAESELGQARTDLYQVESSLAKALVRLDMIRNQVSERARASYKLGSGIYLEFLLGSDNYSDFVNRLQFVRTVFMEDKTRIASVEKLTSQLQQARSDAIQHRDDITAKKLSIEEHKAHVADLQGQMQAARRQVVSEIATRQGLLSQVKQEKAAYVEAMKALEAESRTIAALLRSRQRGQVRAIGSGTRLAWPATGSVTSSYGWRTHPVFGDRRFHAGIDIGASSGSPVIAAESGTVVFAGWKSGYGQVVVVDHGNTLATLYAHMSSISVGSGSRVARAQRVGAVGCTGYCTGPHLHFETRINGDPVDPMQFF